MDLKGLLGRFTAAVEKGDGEALAALFTPDGVYVDGFYGPFQGRAKIAAMIREHFCGHAKDFKWDMLDPVSDGRIGYARYVFSYTSTMPESAGKRVIFDGMCKLELDGGLIERYTELFDAGVALSQLGYAAERILKIEQKRARQVANDPAAKRHAI
jgi:ketosteroid isomerase-like protein